MGKALPRLPATGHGGKDHQWKVLGCSETRLKNIWVGGDVQDFVLVRLDILAPKPEKQPAAKRKQREARVAPALPDKGG